MRKAFIQLHTAVFIAGFTAILGKLITLNEALLVWYRLLFTIITMWAIFCVPEKTATHLRKGNDEDHRSRYHCYTALDHVLRQYQIFQRIGSAGLFFLDRLFHRHPEPVLTRSRFNYIELLLGLIAVLGISLIFHFDPTYKVGIIIGIISALLGSVFPIMNRDCCAVIQRKPLRCTSSREDFFFLRWYCRFTCRSFLRRTLCPAGQILSGCSSWPGFARFGHSSFPCMH